MAALYFHNDSDLKLEPCQSRVNRNPLVEEGVEGGNKHHLFLWVLRKLQGILRMCQSTSQKML